MRPTASAATTNKSIKIHAETTITRFLRPGWAAIGAAFTLMLTGTPAAAQISGVNVYPAVPGLQGSTNYSVRVCASTNTLVWTNAFTFQTSVAANPDTNLEYYPPVKGWSHSYVNFEMSVPVTVEITSLTGSITNAAVHPARYARNVYFSGGKAYLTLNNPCNVAVDINGQMDSRPTGAGYSGPPLNTISIHANPFLAGKPATNDPSVYLATPGVIPPQTGSWTTLYFLPGVHNLGTNFPVYSGKNYYIPGDAIVYGAFNNYTNADLSLGRDSASNIRIFGHGTLSGAKNWFHSRLPNSDVHGVDIQDLYGNAYNVRVEGITIADPAEFALIVTTWTPQQNVTNVVAWVKSFGWRRNTDGNGTGCNNIMENCFQRVQDDNIYVWGPAIRNNVFWTDVNGTAFRFNFLPNSPSLYENNDVIYSRYSVYPLNNPVRWTQTGGTHGNGVIFSNFVFSDPFPSGFAMDISPQPNGVLAGTRFANMTIATPINTAGSKMKLDASASGASIHDLTFDNLVIGGVLVTPSNWLNYFTTNGNVYNIFFTASGTTPPDALPRTGWVASASLNSASVSNAIDGDSTTRWTTGADQANGQWFQMDMQQARTFNKIVLDAGASTNDYPRGYQVTVSNDGTNWSSAVATGSGSNAVITITFATQTARYIRVTQTGSATGTWWSIHEVYAYPPAVSVVFVVLPRTGWVASASLNSASATNAIDGNSSTHWTTGGSQANGQRFQVDMQQAQSFDRIVLDTGPYTSDYPRGYQVNVSNDGVNWGSAVATGSGSSGVTTITFAPQTARYIRVTQTGSVSGIYWTISEFNVYSTTAATSYTLTKSSPNGTVTFNPAWPTYPAGTVVTVTAVPNPGYVFNGWSGGLTGSVNPTNLTMDSNKSVTANFSMLPFFTLATSAVNGSITLNPSGGFYPTGTVVTVTAIPNTGYGFSNWSGALSGSVNPRTLTMNGNQGVTANFTNGPTRFRVNCGGVAYTAAGGVVFAADGTHNSGGSTYSTGSAISGTTDDLLYQSERWGTSFSYNFPLADGVYEVTLMFAEIYYNVGGSRVFNVAMEGTQVITNLDIWAMVGMNAAYNATNRVTVSDGQLNIAFSRVLDNAKISAIQVQRIAGTSAPVVTVSPGTTNFNSSLPVNLAVNGDFGYYSVSGGAYVAFSTAGTNLLFTNTTTLSVYGRDIIGNVGATNTFTYTLNPPPSSPALLTDVTYGSGGSLSFSVTNAGGVYQVQTHTNLASPAGWITVSTNTAPFTYTVTNVPGGAPQRFYRVVTP